MRQCIGLFLLFHILAAAAVEEFVILDTDFDWILETDPLQLLDLVGHGGREQITAFGGGIFVRDLVHDAVHFSFEFGAEQFVRFVLDDVFDG